MLPPVGATVNRDRIDPAQLARAVGLTYAADIVGSELRGAPKPGEVR
jgi:hypothetical protein